MNANVILIIISAVVTVCGGWVAIYKLIEKKLSSLVMRRAEQLTAMLNQMKALDDFKAASKIVVVNTSGALTCEGYLRSRGFRKVKTMAMINVEDAALVIIDRPSQSELDAVMLWGRDDLILLTTARLNVNMSRVQPVNSMRRVYLEIQSMLEEKFDYFQGVDNVSPADTKGGE